MKNNIQTEKCEWCIGDSLYEKYHDEEWGVPVYDDNKLFEMILLETFQAGLSWITILKRREGFREAFDNFDYNKIKNYNNQKVSDLVQNPSIIRHKLKIESTITNAQSFIKIKEEFGSFSNYIWGFTDGKIITNNPKSLKEIPSNNELSNKISKDLKKRGFKFVGSTIIYAMLQAIGIINDHTTTCWKNESF